MPGAFSKSEKGVPRSAGQEVGFQRASLTGAVGSEALSRKVSLHVSPVAPKKERMGPGGKARRRCAFWPN